METRQNVEINTQRVPVGRSIGAGVLVILLLVGLFVDLPGVRGTVIWGGGIGLFLAVALIWWRRRTGG
jgi:hypothetical protein